MTVSQSKPKCGRPKRDGSGDKCARPAGWGTEHAGSGACKLHGGATPIKHGLYAETQPNRLDALIKKHMANPDPLNLLPEVAQLRAFAEDLRNRWEEIYGPDGALLAWHESYNAGEHAPKPRQLPDYSAVSTVVDRVGAMVDRIQKHKAEGAITLETLNRILRQHGVEVVAAIKEYGLGAEESDKLIDLIETRWGRIRVDAA